jgi:enoyl-CoA hydratase/carnithine racemase
MSEEKTIEHVKIELPQKFDEEGNIIKEGVDGNYAVISINRPDRLNAMTFQTMTEIADALVDFELDPEIRCVVLRGVKEYTKKPSFSTGQDLNSFLPFNLNISNSMDMIKYVRMVHRNFDIIEQFSKPLIAAVDGFALGGGTELTLLCDIIIASKRSTFGLTEISRGIFSAAGGTQRLAKRIGINRAIRVLFTGEYVSAETLHKWGLVSFLVDHEKFEKIVHEKAKWLGNAATTALFNMKKCIKFGTRYEQLGVIMEQLAAGINTASSDRAEGRKAFREKREPKYKGY